MWFGMHWWSVFIVPVLIATNSNRPAQLTSTNN